MSDQSTGEFISSYSYRPIVRHNADARKLCLQTTANVIAGQKSRCCTAVGANTLHHENLD